MNKYTIVYNDADHRSFAAAAYAYYELKEAGLNVQMFDIRENIDLEANQTLWIESADPHKYITFLTKQNPPKGLKDTALIPTNIKKWEAESVIKIGRPCVELEDEEHSLLTTTALYVEEILVKEGKGAIDSLDSVRYLSHLVDNYTNPSATAQNLVRYTNYLKNAKAYVSGYMSQSLFEPLMDEPSQRDIEEYKLQHQAFSARINQMSRVVEYAGRPVRVLSGVGLDTYYATRRLAISGQPFIHLSSCQYDKVVWSPFHFLEESECWKGALRISSCAPLVKQAA